MSEEKSMRLSQAARILNRNHVALASILVAKGYKVDNNPNTRLDEEQLTFLAKEFRAEALLRGTQVSESISNETSSIGLKIVGKIDLDSESKRVFKPIQTPAPTPVPKKTPKDLALLRIKEFQQTNQTALNLSDLGLDTIPVELKSLKKIKKLSLANNRIAVIENLPDSIIELDVSNNQLSAINGLPKQVVILKLNRNHLNNLENLPNSIQQLEVNHNDIHQITALPKGLKCLKISNNKLEHISVPPLLEGLAICHNKLIHLPEFPRKLSELYLYGNPIPGIQPDILGENENTNCLRAIKNYKAELERRSEPNCNVKLVLVGNSNVGKSSLLRALKELPHDPTISSTHAIHLDKIEWPNEQKPVHLHVWDLGGQEIYYGTHRIFMKSPAVQVVIFDAETEQTATAPDRFKENEAVRNLKVPFYVSRIHELSSQSKILVVENKSTEVVSPFDNSWGYPTLKVNAQDRIYTHTLKALIRDVATQMSIYGYPVPYYWERVRVFLRETKPRTITKERFYEICRLEKVLEDGFDDLLEHLHTTGALYYRAELGNDIIVDQIWALEAIYKVFDRRSTFYEEMRTQLNGKCTVNTLFDDFDNTDTHYTIEEKWMFLKFMHSCGLCFPLKPNPTDPETLYTHYIFPEFLASEKPHNVKLWLKGRDKVVFKKQFAFLPYYPLHTFISKFGTKTTYDCFWRSGILIYTNAEELQGFCIEADFEKHTLTLTLDESIVSEWYEAIVSSITVHGDRQSTEWKLISGEMRNHESPFEDTVPKSSSDLEMLPDVAQKIALELPQGRKKQIVISYAKEDIEELKLLIQYLSAYSSMYEIWYDNLQDNREIWDDAITKAFQKADGYILLISPNYMSPEKTYIHNNEIPIIQHNQAEKKAYVINLIIRAFPLRDGVQLAAKFNSFNKGEVLPDIESNYHNACDYMTRFIGEELLKKF